MIERQPSRRILVIDDNDAIHGDFRKTLEASAPRDQLAAANAALFGDVLSAASLHAPVFEVESASQGEEGYLKVQAAIRDGKPYSLAFVDMRMPPGWDGVETVQHLWKADPNLQVVICTAFTDYSWEQIIATLGTSDNFLILKKPFDPMEVCQLATAMSEKWKLKLQATLKVSELEKMVHERTAELRALALTDKLTGLPNRGCMQELLSKASARAAADPAFRFALHFIDFDRFKVINDSLGHNAGDQLLMAIAQRLRDLLDQKALPGADAGPCIAARLGGDEFIVLQYGIASVQDTIDLAERLLAALGTPYALEGFEAHCTASIGIATSETGSSWSSDILRDADSAMYSAKALGRARYVLFSQEMHERAMDRLTLENDLRRALREHEFQLCYQPIVALGDRRLVGFEALIRWHHPQRGLISPNDFIPIAEETGLILPVGQWVLEEALRQLQDWTKRIPEAAELSMSVNCARKQLGDPAFPARVIAALEKADIAHDRFNLEITESTIMEDSVNACGILSQLQAAGVHIHMDDFGTGYSSLNCLHTLPLKALKVDRSFIRHLGKRRDYAAVINAIIQLAHNFGMHVVAEGVEGADHVAMLCALECDHAQGYFFSRPLAPDAAEAFIHGGLAAMKLTNPN